MTTVIKKFIITFGECCSQMKYVRNSHNVAHFLTIENCEMHVIHADKTRNCSYFSLENSARFSWIAEKKIYLKRGCHIWHRWKWNGRNWARDIFEKEKKTTRVSITHTVSRKFVLCFIKKMFNLMHSLVYGWEWGDGLVNVTTRFAHNWGSGESREREWESTIFVLFIFNWSFTYVSLYPRNEQTSPLSLTLGVFVSLAFWKK